MPFCVGTVPNAALVTPLDASRNKAGDPVTAETTEVVSYERTVPPRAAKFTAISYAHPPRAAANSALFVQFNKAILKNGQEVINQLRRNAALVTGQGSDFGRRALPSTQVLPRVPSLSPDGYTSRDVSHAPGYSRESVQIRAAEPECSRSAGWRNETREIYARQPGSFGFIGYQGIHHCGCRRHRAAFPPAKPCGWKRAQNC